MIKKCNIQDQSCDFEGGAKTTYPSKASSRARARATQSASYLNGFNSQEQWYSLFYFANMQYWYVFISRKIQGVYSEYQCSHSANGANLPQAAGDQSNQ